LHAESDEDLRYQVADILSLICSFVLEEDGILFDSPTY